MRDSLYLRQIPESTVSSVYLAGVAVECLLRAYKLQNSSVFSSRHDLVELFRESGIVSFLSMSERLKAGAAIAEINRRWRNNYRYTDHKTLLREIIKESVLSGRKLPAFKDKHKFLQWYFKDFFAQTDALLALGMKKWK